MRILRRKTHYSGNVQMVCRKCAATFLINEKNAKDLNDLTFKIWCTIGDSNQDPLIKSQLLYQLS